MFQQDIATVYAAKSIFEWFLDNGVHIIDWTSCSLDLNQVENMWNILARAIYTAEDSTTVVQSLKKLFPRNGRKFRQTI